MTMMGKGFDPSGALEDKDAAGELLGALALFLVMTAAYHWHMASRNEGVAAEQEAAPGDGLKTPASAFTRDGLSSEPEDAYADAVAARKRQDELESDFWSTVSPLDLRHGSHVGVISRFTLGLYRLAVVAYCISMWVFYFRDKTCCDDLQFIEPWAFMLYTLYFVVATFVSIKSPRRDGSVARYEVVMICLYEVAFPMSLFLCVTYWVFLDGGSKFYFPSTHRTLTRIFASLNAVLMLAEWAMNRIVLHSSRWMWVAYLCELYLFTMLVIEKLRGKSYLVYSDANFLLLELTAYPSLVASLISALGSYYFVCALVTLRQYAWTSPLLHPVEGAVRLRPSAAGNNSSSNNTQQQRQIQDEAYSADDSGRADDSQAVEGRTGARASAATAQTPLLSHTDDLQ